jgi:hypothetical protein
LPREKFLSTSLASLCHKVDGAIVVLAAAMKVRHSHVKAPEKECQAGPGCEAGAKHFANFRIAHFGVWTHSTLGTSQFDQGNSSAIREADRE